MVCQLRPLVYIRLNNLPRICRTPRKSRVKKNYDITNRGTVDGKWRGLEFGHLLSSAVKCRRLQQQEQLLGKLLSSGLRIAKFCVQVAAVKSSLWLSALKFILLSVANRATVILFLAICVLNAADCHNPRNTFECGTWQETEFQLQPFYIESPPV
jgi:hypothetical protein